LLHFILLLLLLTFLSAKLTQTMDFQISRLRSSKSPHPVVSQAIQRLGYLSLDNEIRMSSIQLTAACQKSVGGSAVESVQAVNLGSRELRWYVG
jgi:hypothetical protein